jgi:thiol-disulfide isomerase/thioredoxin
VSLERLVILVALVVATVLATLAVRAWNARRTRAVMRAAPLWERLGEMPDGRATLVQFSTASCAACHTAQAPAVAAVEKQVAVRVIEIDAAKRPDIASAFGVLTVPSTVVLAPAGQVVAINQGFAPTRKLVEQLNASG